MSVKIRLFLAVLFILSTIFIFYSYFFGSFWTGADILPSLQSPEESQVTGICPQCLELQYKKEVLSGTRQILSIRIFPERFPESASRTQVTLNVKNEESNLEKATIILSDEGGKVLSEEKTEFVGPLSLEPQKVNNVRFIIKGPEIPIVYKLKVLLLAEDGTLIVAKTITVSQKSLFTYKVGVANNWKVGEQQQLLISKYSLSDLLIQKYAYCVKLENPNSISVFFVDKNGNVKPMFRRTNDGLYIEDCMEEELLDKPAKTLTVPLVFVASQPVRTTASIFDQTYYPVAPIAKRTLDFK